MEKIIRDKTLRDKLRDMEVGESFLIENKQYKTVEVRKSVSVLRKEGKDYEATEKGVIDGIKVTRLK